MSFIARGYGQILKKYPLPTKAITGALITMASDIFCQTLEKRIFL